MSVKNINLYNRGSELAFCWHASREKMNPAVYSKVAFFIA
jgi:hypothetical protein